MSVIDTQKPTRNAKSKTVMPVRRDAQFPLPAERAHDWVGDGGVQFTQLMNTMSLVIPVGERFFIDAVRHYRDQITDPDLKKAATAFIGQEAMHGREHDEYNDRVIQRLPSAAVFEKRVKALLDWFQNSTPPAMRLSGTIALEHITAIMADALLKEPRISENAEKGYAALWRWHALEETEHKGVAYDVWEAAMGKGAQAYIIRAFGLVLATSVFWAMVTPHFLNFVRQEGKLTDLKGWKSFYRMAFGEVGFLRKMVRPWFDYFRPGFHPWDDDNSHYLAEVESFTEAFRTPRAAYLKAA
ncbi:metal-dependent hydrolase [Nevskia sp.]|uniref:metal-dependent hydrolase n=1 Tax=Nevskia sp. TaxID=1929292 RepID=UPI0025E3BFED|nr:metal-dependent hydrolase [Nevskia sp.]